MPVGNKERHRRGRIGWLRAAVLGANDGILSTSSLVLGVAAAHATHGSVLVAGSAGLVAGAMSMAAGEYVSVHSQADTEKAELKLERTELEADDVGEHRELMAIYVARGLDPSLAKQVAEQLMAHDAIGAHARDELGISETLRARPIQAALASAGCFAVGAAMPLLVTAIAPAGLIPLVSGTSLLFLALLGGLAARAGGAGVAMGAIRVTFWGALAMALTAGVGCAQGTYSIGWREFDHFYSNHVVFIRIARHLDALSFVLLCFRATIEQVLAIRSFQDICMPPLRYRPNKAPACFSIRGPSGGCFRMSDSITRRFLFKWNCH
jgi:VIT1/CCC1 family predicted Fe2+/Mn2+ transporter